MIYDTYLTLVVASLCAELNTMIVGWLSDKERTLVDP